MIKSLSGFDPLLLAETDDRARRSLGLQNWIALAALLLTSMSMAYVFAIGTQSVVSGIAVGMTTFALLAALQGQITAGTGSAIDTQYPNLDNWDPHGLRIWIALIVAAFFSQPVMISIYSITAPEKAFGAVRDRQSLRAEFEQNDRIQQADRLQNQLAVQHELLARVTSLDPTRPNAGSLQSVLTPTQLKRKALLIGNQNYPTSPLNNPRKDVADLNAALKEIGFSTTVLIDAGQQAMEMAIGSYIAALKPGDISFFYYTGHGFQDNGNNYLVPTDFTGLDRNRAVGLNTAIEAMGARNPAASIVVIDACRSFVSARKGGLASTEAGANTYLAFAAKPGQFAQDGPPGTNGKFTAALLNHIRQPDHVDQMFMDVRKEVAERTNNTQETWSAHNLHERIYLPSASIQMAPRQSKRSDPVQSMDKLAVKAGDPQSCESRVTQVRGKEASSFLRRCVAARILKLEDDISALNQTPDIAINAEDTDRTKTSGLTASDLRLLLQAMWTNGLFMALATAVMILLLASAFLWRHFDVTSLRAYENGKLRLSRESVKEAHDAIGRHLDRKDLDLAAWKATYLPELRFEKSEISPDPRTNEALVDRSPKGFIDFVAFHSGKLKGATP